MICTDHASWLVDFRASIPKIASVDQQLVNMLLQKNQCETSECVDCGNDSLRTSPMSSSGFMTRQCQCKIRINLNRKINMLLPQSCSA